MFLVDRYPREVTSQLGFGFGILDLDFIHLDLDLDDLLLCCPDPNEKIWIWISSVFAEIYFLDNFIIKNPYTENTIN